MGSPITFSGFNSIDFNMILNAVMAQERTPLNRLETHKNTLETQNTAFGTLAGKLGSLETAIENLKADDSLAFLTATSTDVGVGVSTTSGTVTGTYDIVVTELAKAQVTASTTTWGALTTEVATGGTLTLTPSGGGAATVITVSASTSLQQLADQINAATDSPAAASVVQTSPGVYKLVLSGRETGTTSDFTVTSAMTGGTGVAFEAVNTQDAIDAEFTVNGLDVTSASNTVSDVIAGVTLSLTRKDPATTVTVKVDRDNDKAKALINKFISAYNDLQTFAKDQATAAIAGKASIGRDPLLRGLRDALRSASMDEYSGGTLTRLAEIGVGFDMSGKMILDSDVFNSAISASPAAVQTLVSGATGDGGAFGAFATLVEDYTEAGGLVALTRQRIDEQVTGIGKRLDTMESALALRKASLQREYIAADLAMTRLKAQSASLSSVGGGFRLF
ncbi:MAG TPA: flagellar filament capping protein FliD [Vicinamibacterales bacterium]